MICEIDEAVRFNDRATALKKADELLKIKPGHHRGSQGTRGIHRFRQGGRGAARPLEKFSQPWNEGGWIPWSVLAFGLAVAGVFYAIVVIQLGKTAVVIDIQDAGISVAIADKGKKIEIITGPGESKIEVESGDQELNISYAGLEDTNPALRTEVGTKAARDGLARQQQPGRKLDQESLPLIDQSEKAGPGKPGGKPPRGEPVKIATARTKGPPSRANEKPAVTPAAAPAVVPVIPVPADSFVPLFNGRDLAGWKTHPSQPGNWRVENGVLIGSGSDASHLYTDATTTATFISASKPASTSTATAV